MGIDTLPIEIVFIIVEGLSIRDHYNLVCTCSTLSIYLTPTLKKLGLEDVGGLTALQWAAGQGHLSLVKLALSRGAEVDAATKCSGKYTALHLASMSQKPNCQILHTLVRHGAKVNKPAKGHLKYNVLHLAVLSRKSNPELIRTLVGLGAKINTKDTVGHSPLYRATAGGRTELVEELLRLGAGKLEGKKLGEIAHLAARCKDVNLMRALVSTGVNLNARWYYGHSVLHQALLVNNFQTARYLLELEKGRDIVDCGDAEGNTPLHLAVLIIGARARSSNELREWVEIFELLLQSGADVLARDKSGDMAAHFAASGCDIDLMCRLLLEGSCLGDKGKDGQLALHKAARSGTLEMIEYLLEVDNGKWYINAQDDNGRTPLHLAIISSRNATERIILLLKHGADVESKDNGGFTPPLLAIRHRKFDLLEAFKLAGIDLDSKGSVVGGAIPEEGKIEQKSAKLELSQ